MRESATLMALLGHSFSVLRRLQVRMRKRSTAGSTAIEFAVVAPVFFLLLFGIIETGLVFFASTALENATNDAARMIRTGQVQTSAMTQSAFRDRICNEVTPLLACDTNLQVDVESYSGFGGANFTSPTSGGVLNPALNNFSPGSAGDVVLVRTFYTWHIFTPLLQPFLANLSNGSHLVSATAAFRNEPYN